MLEKSSVKRHMWLLCCRETDSQKSVTVRDGKAQMLQRWDSQGGLYCRFCRGPPEEEQDFEEEENTGARPCRG